MRRLALGARSGLPPAVARTGDRVRVATLSGLGGARRIATLDQQTRGDHDRLVTPIPRRTEFEFFDALDLTTADGRVPDVLRVFKMGANKTTKGTFFLTPEGCKRSIAWFASYGNDLVFDYEHLTFELVKSLAAGWVRQGDQWADEQGLYVRVHWQPQAREEIAGSYIRYFSPTFEYDYETGEILCLLPCALTNFPATLHMTPLAEQGLRALAARQAVPPEGRRVRVGGRTADPPGAPAPSAPAPLAPETTSTAGGASAPAPNPPAPPARASGAPPVVPAAAPASAPKGHPMDLLTFLRAMLGLPATATEPEILSALTRLNDAGRDVLRLTGTATHSEAIGRVAAWKDGYDRLKSLQTELETARAAAASVGVVAKVDAAIAETRCPPTQRDFAIKLGQKDGAALDEFLASCVPLASPGGPPKPPVPPSGGGGAPTTTATGHLSADEIKVLKLQGMTDAQIAQIAKEAPPGPLQPNLVS